MAWKYSTNNDCYCKCGRYIHIHFGWTACTFLGATADLGAPIVVSLYGHDLFEAKGKYQRRLQQLLRSPDLHVHVTSEALKTNAVKMGATPRNVFVVPVGIVVFLAALFMNVAPYKGAQTILDTLDQNISWFERLEVFDETINRVLSQGTLASTPPIIPPPALDTKCSAMDSSA